jgi:putative flippase GtrA
MVHQAVVYALGYTINPAFSEELGDQLRFTRSATNNTVAFLVSNTVAYLLNIQFVFQSGRYRRRTEVALFFLASAISFFPALYALDVVIRMLSLNSHFANIAFAAVAASANFVVRKFLIFHR